MTLIAIIAALSMGFVLGLLGGGGSIMAVPILVFLVGLGDKAGIATSLLVVGATSAIAAISHARAGNVAWRTGAVFGAFAMAGAYLGGRLAQLVSGELLIAGFALIMLIAATLMLRGGKKRLDAPEQKTDSVVPFTKLIPMGLGVGLLTGLVGAGGGFVIVPALVVFAGLPMRQAIGTSLAVIALNSFAGFAGYIGHIEIDYALAGGFVAASVIGSFLGAATSRRVDARRLRTGFAYFVLIAGTFILGEQLGSPITYNIIVALIVVFVAFGVRYLSARRGSAESMPTS